MGLEASELARWTRFAAKGGIGTCTATCDCVAESTDDLMFLKDDEITVLLQLPDMENLFLGYCEGVVGHFSGSDVHFHAKLKVPVKAKRASTIDKSPPTASDNASPSGQSSSRRSSTSKTETDSTLDRRASQQRRVQTSSRIQSLEDEQQRYPPSLTFSSSSTGTDSVVTTPAVGYFSSPEIRKSSIHGTPASSPRDPQFSIEAPRSKSMPPTRASSPPSMFVSHSQATMVPTVQKKNTHNLNLTPETTVPLRINKRTPTSPSVPQFSPDPSQSVSQPPPSVPDTSHSTCKERPGPQTVGMSDVEVGIGLSLLQDLANGVDSDSDDDDDQWPQHGSAAGTPDLHPYAAALNRVGHRRDSIGEGTQESTVEGLGYALSEDNHEKRELAGTEEHTVIVEDMPSQTASAVTTRRASPNLSINSNSNASTGRNPNIFLPSSTSPTSPSFSRSSSTNERQPSLAASASSASEWEGASDIYDDYRYSRYSIASKMSRFSSSAGWTGSVAVTPPLPDSSSIGRARTDSSKSRPDSCARSRTDSMNTRSTVDSLSPSFEMKGVAGGSLLSPLPLLAEASEIGGQEPQESQQQDDLHSKRSTILKERTMSMESAGSVYTQNSCLSTQSQEALSPGSNANDHSDTPSAFSDSNGKIPVATNGRPTPLSLSQSDIVKSLLLHTTGDTPLSSAIDGPSATTESLDLRTPMVGGGPTAGVGIPFGFTEEGGRKGSSDTMMTGSFGHGVNGVGIASALRQRLETERRSPTPEQTQNQRLIRNSSVRRSFTQSDGLGHRIVVDDEDELPSRILDNSTATLMTMSPEPMYDEEDEEKDVNEDHAAGGHDRRSTSSSPDPDLMMLRTRLAPLTIANRTPSPFEGGTDDVGGSRRAAEVEDEKEEQEREREREEGMAKEASSPIIPTAPPLNGSSTPLPPQASISSSSPHNPTLPRLSSSSTIRIDSPPIDLRPPLALSDIREPGGPLIPGSKQRQSLFLPHPNAPKSLGDSVVAVTGLAGPDPGVPMYIAAQQQGRLARGAGGVVPPARPNVIGVIRMALSAPPRVAMVRGQGQGEQGSSGQRSPLMMSMRGPTIYGRMEADLTGSLVPVPIVFSIDPPHVVSHPSNPTPTYLAPPQGAPTFKLAGMPSSPPRSPMQSTTKQQSQSEPQQHPPGSLSLGTPAGARTAAVGPSVSDVGPSAGEGDHGDVTSAEPKAEGPIPRPNFSPKSPRMRPRSRSFSCSTNAEAPQQIDEAEIPSKDVKRSLSTSVSSSSNLSSSPSSPSKSKLASIRLPPLSLPGHLNLRQSALRSPNSPLVQSIVPPVPLSPNHLSMGIVNRAQHHLRRETSSSSALNETLPSPSRPIPISRPTIPASTIRSVDSPAPSSPSQSLSHTASIHAQSRNDSSSRVSDADAASINSDTRSHLAVTRQLSLRTKLSLPNLRRNRSRQEDDSGGGDGEMLQVKDTEFQLVTPNFVHFQASRPSDDSAKDVDIRQDGNAFLRTESPAYSGTSKLSPLSDLPASSSWSPLSPSTPTSRATSDSGSSMDAHRNRETKWMSLMSSSPASQARKSKKVRKLIMDGVPSSVRYLVWSYLTDGKARCVPGVYAQLCSRGRVPSSADIERDSKNCFQDQPHLLGTQCPVVLLLQAYFNMVPDIVYTKGLTLIVGQLLLLAPEEDAFWIFISIMDTHIRPYFSTVTTQMEVDAALFSRALENNDHQVARKILVDLGISPPTICQPWFSSLFVGTLPPDYLNRIWDLFLFEGIPFLLRVALAIVTCCRLAILESTSEETALDIFRYPPQSLLPPSPDAFLSLVCSVKLKDDDVRKQRIKMEAQVKRQTQVPRTVSTSGGISLPRT